METVLQIVVDFNEVCVVHYDKCVIWRKFVRNVIKFQVAIQVHFHLQTFRDLRNFHLRYSRLTQVLNKY